MNPPPPPLLKLVVVTTGKEEVHGLVMFDEFPLTVVATVLGLRGKSRRLLLLPHPPSQGLSVVDAAGVLVEFIDASVVELLKLPELRVVMVTIATETEAKVEGLVLDKRPLLCSRLAWSR